MKKVLLGLLVLFVSALSYAQGGKTITGSVTDESGEALPGVSVVIKGTTTGTITNMDGEFSLRTNADDDVIVFSFIGFAHQEVNVAGKTTVNIRLREDVTDLDEVVVVGYGEVRKSDLTGAMVSVRTKDEVARQYTSVDQLLQGRASGVQVTSNDGSPGSAISVRIRGANSLNGSNEPLYVVDGVIINSPLEDVNANTGGDSNELPGEQSGLTGLNNNDIETIEVLKDASATAIYGSLGANGVVLITTKSGASTKAGKPKVSVYATTDFATISNKIDLLDGHGYARYQNEKTLGEDSDPYFIGDNNIIYGLNSEGTETVVDSSRVYTPVDWQDEVYQLGISSTFGGSISANSEGAKYYFSANYGNQNGVVDNSNIKRGDLRFNTSHKLGKKIKFDNRVSLMYQDGSFANAGSKSGGTRSFTNQVLTYRPLLQSTTNEFDEEIDEELETSNPYSWFSDYKDLSEELRINIASTIDYEIVKHLKYRFKAGLDIRRKERSKWYGLDLFKGAQETGVANYSNLNRHSYNIDNLLMYNRKINKHSINAMLGMTYTASKSRSEIYEIGYFEIPTLEEKLPQAGSNVLVPYAFGYSDQEMLSGLGRIVYSFKDKYSFTGTLRADKSSKFAKGNQTAYFPSGAFAWRASEEPFIRNLNVFQNLKIRAGWGMSGNQAVGPYQTLATYSPGLALYNGKDVITFSADRIPNPSITWETTEQINIGIDAGFFDGRLTATIDAYDKETRDLLQRIQLGPSATKRNMWGNLGAIGNRGFEVALTGVIVDKSNWFVSVGGNIGFNKTEVKSLGSAPVTRWENGVEKTDVFYLGDFISSGTYMKYPVNIFMEGQEVGMFYGYETDGIYQLFEDDLDEAGEVIKSKEEKYSEAYGENAETYANLYAPGDVIYVNHRTDDGGFIPLLDEDGNEVVDENGEVVMIPDPTNQKINDDDRVIIGNPNPDFTYGININAEYKNITLSVLLNGVQGNEIVNGYNSQIGSAEGQSNNILTEAYEQAWRADAQTNAYPRIGYNNREKFSDRLVEDGSYLRCSNITLGYNVKLKKSSIIDRIHIYGSVKNAFTITNYSGYNPQVTSFLTNGMIRGVDWTGSPNVRTYLLGLNLSF